MELDHQRHFPHRYHEVDTSNQTHHYYSPQYHHDEQEYHQQHQPQEFYHQLHAARSVIG